MILIDTSAWIEFLRDTGSPTCEEVDRLLARATVLPTGTADYESAAALYRTCRQRGETARKLVDCLIAAIAIREGVPIIQADNDFDALARRTPLQIRRPG